MWKMQEIYWHISCRLCNGCLLSVHAIKLRTRKICSTKSRLLNWPARGMSPIPFDTRTEMCVSVLFQHEYLKKSAKILSRKNGNPALYLWNLVGWGSHLTNSRQANKFINNRISPAHQGLATNKTENLLQKSWWGSRVFSCARQEIIFSSSLIWWTHRNSVHCSFHNTFDVLHPFMARVSCSAHSPFPPHALVSFDIIKPWNSIKRHHKTTFKSSLLYPVQPRSGFRWSGFWRQKELSKTSDLGSMSLMTLDDSALQNFRTKANKNRTKQSWKPKLTNALFKDEMQTGASSDWTARGLVVVSPLHGSLARHGTNPVRFKPGPLASCHWAFRINVRTPTSPWK